MVVQGLGVYGSHRREGAGRARGGQGQLDDLQLLLELGALDVGRGHAARGYSGLGGSPEARHVEGLALGEVRKPSLELHSRPELFEERVAVEGLEELLRSLGPSAGAVGSPDAFDGTREVEDLAVEGVGGLAPDRRREQEEGEEGWG